MPNSLLSSLLSAPVIKFIDERTVTRRWVKLKVKSVEIESSSDNASLPLSNNQINSYGTFRQILESDITTGKIFRPTRMRIVAMAPDVSTASSVIQAFRDLTSTMQITSKSIIASSMVMTIMDMEQIPENLSSTLFTMEFEQAVAPGSASKDNPRQPGDRTTIGVRIQTPTSLTQSVANLYTKVAKTIGF